MTEQINRNRSEVMRDEMVMKDRIITLLQKGPKNIPEIAEALKYPDYEITYWVMAMWRYGILKETGKANAEGYFSYAPKEANK